MNDSSLFLSFFFNLGILGLLDFGWISGKYFGHSSNQTQVAELDFSQLFLAGQFCVIYFISSFILQVDLIQLTLQAKIAWSSFDTKPN